jgi:hypothetical protein
MNCVSPVRVRSNEGESFAVPCTKCLNCRIQNSREWSLRLMHERAYYDHSGFFTFTFSDVGLANREVAPWRMYSSVDRAELVKLMKRLRAKVAPRRLKYFAVGEYGEKYCRPHYHAIIFGEDISTVDWTMEGTDPKYGIPYGSLPEWPYGHTYIGTVETDSCRYVAEYLQKEMRSRYNHGGVRADSFKIVSQGIGQRYCRDNARKLRRLLHDTQDGARVGIPRQYREWLGIEPEEYREAVLARLDVDSPPHQYDTNRLAYSMNARQVERGNRRKKELWSKGSM